MCWPKSNGLNDYYSNLFLPSRLCVGCKREQKAVLFLKHYGPAGGSRFFESMEQTKLGFEKDIKPLFREVDIESMIPFDLDLSSYQDVRGQAQSIFKCLSDGTMPCDEAWSDEKIGKFRRWMEEGMEA